MNTNKLEVKDNFLIQTIQLRENSFNDSSLFHKTGSTVSHNFIFSFGLTIFYIENMGR